VIVEPEALPDPILIVASDEMLNEIGVSKEIIESE
jgi:hypothetical protein